METITIKDVARLCGVGVSTVSRAINNHPDINDETKNRIMKVIKEYNYIPNNSARNLKRIDNKSIAVLIKGISNPFFNQMIQIFEKDIKEKKYSFILQRVDDRENELDVALELLKEKKPRGIVFLGGSFSHSEEKLKQLEVPFVLSTIGMTHKLEHCVCSSVSVDDVKESYQVVDYLCCLGHRRIAIIKAREDDESIGKLRFLGYKKALQDHGIPLDPQLFVTMDDLAEAYSMENGYIVTKCLLEKKVDFSAIFAISDSLAIGACKAITDRGKRVPDDYSVAGFDGLDIGRYYNPSLTTIRQPVEEMAEETIRILFDVIKKHADHQKRIFPAQLVIGESTKEYKE